MSELFRILLVDDDRRMTRTLADILTLTGYEVVEAESGAEALQKVADTRFDCVLSDIKMPEMDGVELHRRMREMQPGLPVILMTAYAANELISRGLEDGVVGVFDKPLDINYLLGFFTSLQKNRMIVIVDDDEAFCRTLNDILLLRGFKVTQVTDPHTAVDSFTESAQVILLDMKLNGLTGLDVLKEIRKNHSSLPVLMVTGHRQEMTPAIEAALQINAQACLYKPLEIPRLLDMLSDIQKNRLRTLLKNH